MGKPHTAFRILAALVALTAVFFAVRTFVYLPVMMSLQGTEGTQTWETLCQSEDCTTFPDRHATYDIDGTLYYFPASTQPDAFEPDATPSFFGVLPIGHKRSESRFRRSIQLGRTCCTGWGPLDFDLFLETRADNTVSRSFGRVLPNTDTIRFGRGVLNTLPEYFGVNTTHPSGPLDEFRFFLHSHENRGDHFLLNSWIRSLVQQSASHDRDGDTPISVDPLNTAADLADANLPSFNDAFWIIADRRADRDRGPYLFNGLAVVSKTRLLHGRHVFGYCNSQCQFYSIWFRDDPLNVEPLVRVDMQGADIDVLRRRECHDLQADPACDPALVSLSDIHLRFQMIEDVIDALRAWPNVVP